MKKWGDRRGARMVRELDSMHVLMPMFFLSRCDNEAYISERIDLTNVNAYLETLADRDPEYKYNMFQIIVTAMLKAVTLRPMMNRFIQNQIVYERNEVSASFVVKKMFTDEAEEGLAFIHARPEDTLETIHDQIRRQVMSNKDRGPKEKGKKDPTSSAMDQEGFIYFRGRAKRMIVTSGYNVYPASLENIIDAQEDVQMSCVIGVPDPYKMQKVKAFVMLKPGRTPDSAMKEKILEHCRRHIAKYAMPYDIEFREELPKTLVGKVAYRVLEEEEAARETAKEQKQ